MNYFYTCTCYKQLYVHVHVQHTFSPNTMYCCTHTYWKYSQKYFIHKKKTLYKCSISITWEMSGTTSLSTRFSGKWKYVEAKDSTPLTLLVLKYPCTCGSSSCNQQFKYLFVIGPRSQTILVLTYFGWQGQVHRSVLSLCLKIKFK